MMVAMWFLLIAPQRKKQKEHQKMVSSLQAGDEVLTQGGLYGTVTNIKDERVTVRLSDSAKAEVSKAYIASVTRKG
jgi:preprotein translocase subunit YajC